MQSQKNLTIMLSVDDIGKLQILQRKLCNTASGVIRFLINDYHEKNFSQNSTTVLQPQPPSPSPTPAPAPAARHVPTVEELVADYRADGCMMPTYWRDLTEEERDRVARECNLSEGDLEFLEETLEENR